MSETAVVPFNEATVDIYRDPDEVLAEAAKAARALKKVIESKPRVVKFNNEIYLEIEDWCTIGRFYGLTVKTGDDWTEFVEIDGVKGFRAKAFVIDRDEVVRGSASSLCMRDEPNWERKPLFQLSSMAQTRAASKAFSSVLRFVPILAGYRGTPAEEMTHEKPAASPPLGSPQAAGPVEASASPASLSGDDAKRQELQDMAQIACDLGWYHNYGDAIHAWSKWVKDGKEYGYRDASAVKFLGSALKKALAEFKTRGTDPKKRDVEVKPVVDENQDIPADLFPE